MYLIMKLFLNIKALRNFYSFFFLLAFLPAISNGASYYRSSTSGNWSATGTWQYSSDGTTWGSASSAPTSGSTVTVQNAHTVTINAISTLDQIITVNSGGTLSASKAATFTG